MSGKNKIKNLITRQEQMSDALLLNLILVFSGGFQDAYTYIVRNKVFANAQTGNIVLMSTNFLAGKWQKGFTYLFPIFFFMMGIFIADNIQSRFKYAKSLHWRQTIVLAEALIMILVGFLPQEYNMLSNCLISFSCALQLQAFKKVHGNNYASTMCIGNMKSGVTALSAYIRTNSIEELKKFNDYFMVIVIFAIGAGIGGNFSLIFNERTIWISGALCFISFLLMYLKD